MELPLYKAFRQWFEHQHRSRLLDLGGDLIIGDLILAKHSAMVSRKLARSVRFESPDKAYLAGLLHDIGYIVNLVLAPQKMKEIIERGSREHIFMGEIEQTVLGFTHCQSGEFLAHRWLLVRNCGGYPVASCRGIGKR